MKRIVQEFQKRCQKFKKPLEPIMALSFSVFLSGIEETKKSLKRAQVYIK
jgi:hypothetical protein